MMASILDFLNPQAAQVPQQSQDGSMTNVMQGPEAAAPTQAVDSSPGFLEKSKSWLNENPQLATMLMTAFTSMAGNNGTGSTGSKIAEGVAQGGRAFMLMGAQGKEEAEAAAKLSREERDKERTNSRLDRTEDRQAQTAGFNNEQTQAQTAEMKRSSKEKLSLESVNKTAVLKKMELLDSQILAAQDQRVRDRLQTQRDTLEFGFMQKYGAAEKEAALEAKNVAVAGAKVDLGTKSIAQNAAVEEAEVLANLTPEEKKNRALGVKPTAPKAVDRSKSFNDYMTDRRAEGDKRAMPAIFEEWKIATDAANGTGPAPVVPQADWARARNSVPVGQYYLGPDGVRYKRNK